MSVYTPGATAIFDTNGFDYYSCGLYFGGTTGSGTLYYTTGGTITYTAASSAANDPGPALLSGNLYLRQGIPRCGH